MQILAISMRDFGPTLAMEKLAERHQNILAKETARRVQIAAGLWIPLKLRPPKVQQPRLRRRLRVGAPACTVLVYVDDATSRLMLVHSCRGSYRGRTA